MSAFHDLTTAQLKQAVQIREQIESLQEKLNALLGGTSSSPTKGKRVVSAGTKRKMAAAQQAQRAKGNGGPTPMVAKKKGGLTAAGRAKLAAAMKARWAAKKKVAAE